jgi:hypothetical protein
MNAPSADILRSMSQLGALCSDLGIHDQALAILHPLTLLRDHAPNALVVLALAQSRAGDEAAARATLLRALQADPLHDMARVMLAIHQHRVGDPAAAELLRSVLAHARDADALALAASVQGEILGAPPLAATAPERTARLRYTRLPAGPIDQAGERS